MNPSGFRAATIDINSVNLNINELYKQYSKKSSGGCGGGSSNSNNISSNFNNTTHV